MSHNRVRETTVFKNLSVASKCLAIVLISKSKKNSQDNHEWDDTVVDTTDGNVIVQSSEVHKALSPNGFNGKELLQDFKIRNKTCYWNPSLVESIKSLEYKGFVEPSTILVSGGDIHIENIRSAWGRRVLKAPAGFIIERIGDVNGIQMQEIPQTQFMPLPDALCNVIMELNVQRVVATLDVILDKLTVWYKDMTLPDHALIVDTLGALIKDRKVFHTGSGYFVVTPDTSRLPSGANNNSTYLPTNASWLPYHPMYVPVFQGQAGPPILPSRSHMRSISCQVTTIEETEDEEESEELKEKTKSGHKVQTLTRASRPQSIRKGKEAKVTDKDKPLGKGGKADAEGNEGKPVSGGKQKSDKGKEKTSLLSKIFGRNKKKNVPEPPASVLMPPPPLPPPPPCQPIAIPAAKPQTAEAMTSKILEPQEKEYATFSAQFPPVEWMWYQQQLEKQKRTESWVTRQTTKPTSSVVPTVSRRPPVAARTIASNQKPHSHVRKSLMPLNSQHDDYLTMNSMNNISEKKNPVPLGSLQYDGGFLKPLRPDNLYESFRNPSASKHRHRNAHRKSRDLDYVGEENAKPPHHPYHHNTHHTNLPHHKKLSDYDFIDQADITPINASAVYHSVSGLSPVGNFSDESTYAKLTERQHLGPLHSTPRYGANGPPGAHGYNERTGKKVDTVEGRERASDIAHRRKSHRSKRRNHRAYNYYGHGDDISYEYKGRLPNKNSSRVQSRDSGVNCMGLGANNDQAKEQTGNIYENTPANKKHQNGAKEKPALPDNHVHFDVNNLTCATESISIDPYASTTSIAYQSEVTNPAFSSVVYGSSPCTGHLADNETGPIGSSIMYQSIPGSVLESSEVICPQPSPQSAYNEDSSMANPPRGVVLTIQAEINHQDTEEFIDVEGGTLPDIREVAGSSHGMLEIAAQDDTTKVDAGCDSNQEIDVEGSGDDECIENGTVFDIVNREVDGKLSNSVDQEKELKMSNSEQVKQVPSVPFKTKIIVKDVAVADSGFNSPRNPDVVPLEARGQTSSQSQLSEHSSSVHGDVQTTTTESSDGHAHSEENTGSEGHQTQSDDAHMASSEHHSGSTNDNGEVHSEDSSVKSHGQRGQLRHSSHSGESYNVVSGVVQPTMQQPIHTHPPHIAKMITHPDVFNNNTTNLYHTQDRVFHVQPVLNSNFNSQRASEVSSVNRDRHSLHSDGVDWSSHTSSQRHMFEEEQLSKKYGGDFEVMGIL